MKNLILFLSFSLIFSALYAQNDCKFIEDGQDDFTGERLVKTKLNVASGDFMGAEYLNIGFTRQGDEFLVNVYFQSGKVVNKSFIDTSDVLLIKIAPEAISLKAKIGHQSDMQAGYGIVVKSFTSEYVISKEDFEKLATYTIEKIRLTIDSGSRTMDFEVKPKNANNIVKNAACVWKTVK